MTVLNNVEPKKVISFFEEICSMPHGSSNTAMISNYLVNFARERNLEVIQDKLGNVIIFKRGTTGYEKSKPVIIQGHMDMVCEKEDNCNIDFTKDGLELVLDGNVLSAKGTTLGGDDGIAVAYALALLDSNENEVEHPPLEVVITVDEEIGMLGADYLDCSPLKGKMLLNIDSEEEGKLLVSCAGGLTATCKFDICKIGVASDKECMKLKVCNATGGHSGVEIDKESANATKLMGRLLYGLYEKVKYNLVSVDGGLKDNAIPRVAEAIIFVDKDSVDKVNAIVDEYKSIFINEYRSTDPELDVVAAAFDSRENQAMDDESTKNIIDVLMLLPNGVVRMSKDIKDLVETSLNLGIVKTTSNQVSFSLLVRSSIDSCKEAIAKQIMCIADNFGGEYISSGVYPGWEYKEDSKLRKVMGEVYEKMYGSRPVIEAIHAGLECGLFAGKIEDLDCVSFGPQIDDIHTTSERIYIDSINRTWKYILEVLKKLK